LCAYDSLSIFSNFGQGTVHLERRANTFTSTVLNNSYDNLRRHVDGTPFVTGVVALLKAQDPTRDCVP